MVQVPRPLHLPARPARSKAGAIREGMTAKSGSYTLPAWQRCVLPAPVHLETEVMSLFHHALRVWAQRRAFRAAYAELARHTDRELSDMGIERRDITRIAYAEAERRIVTPVASSTPSTGGHSPDLVPAE